MQANLDLPPGFALLVYLPPLRLFPSFLVHFGEQLCWVRSGVVNAGRYLVVTSTTAENWNSGSLLRWKQQYKHRRCNEICKEIIHSADMLSSFQDGAAAAEYILYDFPFRLNSWTMFCSKCTCMYDLQFKQRTSQLNPRVTKSRFLLQSAVGD
jgi:hypothetical protein